MLNKLNPENKKNNGLEVYKKMKKAPSMTRKFELLTGALRFSFKEKDEDEKQQKEGIYQALVCLSDLQLCILAYWF